jgi:hypothetical protein
LIFICRGLCGTKKKTFRFTHNRSVQSSFISDVRNANEQAYEPVTDGVESSTDKHLLCRTFVCRPSAVGSDSFFYSPFVAIATEFTCESHPIELQYCEYKTLRIDIHPFG